MIGVSVSAMWWPKTHGFLQTFTLQLRQGCQFLQCDGEKLMGFCIFLFICLLPKADTQPKAKICSKREDLGFAVITFGSLLIISKNQISCRRPKSIQTWRFSVCCYHFWKPADNLQKPNILPKTKIWSKGEDLVFAVATFGSLLTISKNQISCRRRKYGPNMKI